ncbi:Protein FAR1-RELATED SEQUENCE 5 [Glycine soja]|uniref:Protein FAR1-RELATED SEQUENCE 5 n=1 Tax=Glycine soja TaxID=3848 RepID=A0A445LQN7_GLYSO|nr:Protein FAR1-RELATED SEQUENCE 5 [Glycine soja]
MSQAPARLKSKHQKRLIIWPSKITKGIIKEAMQVIIQEAKQIFSKEQLIQTHEGLLHQASDVKEALTGRQLPHGDQPESQGSSKPRDMPSSASIPPHEKLQISLRVLVSLSRSSHLALSVTFRAQHNSSRVGIYAERNSSCAKHDYSCSAQFPLVCGEGEGALLWPAAANEVRRRWLHCRGKACGANEPHVDCSDAFNTSQVFECREDVLRWARSVTHENGFVAMILRSDTNTGSRGRTTFVLIGCERSDEYRCRKKEFIRRDTGTRKCGCPFNLRCKPVVGGEGWMVKLICGVHNHELAKSFVGHPCAGRLTKAKKTLIVDMKKSMVKPRNILLTLKEHNVNSCTTIKQIYNARSAFCSSITGSDLEMQHLMKLLERDQYIHWHKIKDEDMVCDIFWCHLDAVKLVNTCNLVFLIDNTYKTNRYRLPLLDFVGVTQTGMTFSVGFAYVEGERVNNLVWALQQFQGLFLKCDALPGVIVTDRDQSLMNAEKDVFPECTNLLCSFHINKNVKAKSMSRNPRSTKRNPSYWEYVDAFESMQNSNLPVRRTASSSKQPNRRTMMPMLDQFQPFMHDFIDKIVDVKADEDYIKLFGGTERFEELRMSLLVDGLTKVTTDKWMDITDMGHVIASSIARTPDGILNLLEATMTPTHDVALYYNGRWNMSRQNEFVGYSFTGKNPKKFDIPIGCTMDELKDLIKQVAPPGIPPYGIDETQMAPQQRASQMSTVLLAPACEGYLSVESEGRLGATGHDHLAEDLMCGLVSGKDGRCGRISSCSH